MRSCLPAIMALGMVMVGAFGWAGCHQPGGKWDAPPTPQPPASPVVTVTEADPPAPVGAPGTKTGSQDVDEQVRGFVDRLARLDEDAAARPSLPARRGVEDGTAPQQKAIPDKVAANQPLQAETPVAKTLAEKPAAPAAPKPAAPQVLSLAVRNDVELPVDPSPPMTRTTNAALASDPASGAMSVERYAVWLQDQARASPQDMDLRWRLAMQQLALDRAEGKGNVLDGLPEDTQQLLDRSMEAIEKLRRASENPARGTEDALQAVEALRIDLRKNADLRIPTIKLCSKVVAFGVYEPLPEDALQPHRPNRAIVYLEVENFASEPADDEQWRTKLACRLELLTPEGRSLWKHEEPNIEDVSRRHRTDFFIAQLVTLPATLAPGSYTLKVTVEDTLAAKVNEASLPVTIGDGTLLGAVG